MLALSGVSFAAANDPAAAALGFLEKVRGGTVDLAPGVDTAMSPHTSAEKREQISRRLDRLADDLGKGRLEAVEIKVDENLAGVIVRNMAGFDPSKIRVFSIAMVKSQDQWLPAPVPSSFENTGASLAAAAKQRLSRLEEWMMQGQVAELTQLREQTQQRMQRDIRAAMDPQILRDESPEKVVKQFLDACQRQDLPTILGFLGGLQAEPPEDWVDRLRSADAAVTAGKKVGWPWRLVVAPEVIRVPVSDGGETSDTLFSFACLDPAGSGLGQTNTKVEILHLELSRDVEGLWKIDLPPAFLLSPGEEPDDSDDDFVKSLLDEFPGEVRKQIPAKPGSSLAETSSSLMAALNASTLPSLLSLMDLDGDPGSASRGAAVGARLWWQIHNPEAPRMPLLLGHHEKGKAGVVTVQFFSPREPGSFDLKSFYFERTAQGWLLMPGLRPTNSPSEDQIAVKDWVGDRTRTWRDNWQTKLTAECARLDKMAEGNAPSEQEARQLVENWIHTTGRADIPKALDLLVLMNRQGEIQRTLQNLGFEFSAALREGSKATVIHCERGTTWTAVGVKSQTGKDATFPLYLVVATPRGPKILIGADLFGDSTRSRNKLNEVVLNRIQEFSAPGPMEELRSLFDKFRDTIPK